VCLIANNKEGRSEIPTISILTCDSGDQLYSTYGHTGVRIRHDDTRYDVVYGYGTFDTRQSGFYLKFMRGKLMYYLSATSYQRFMAEYTHHQRSVVEQVLELDSLQAYQMISFLENNIKEENKYYKYDFFFDNCSTRIRDIFDSEFGVKWTEETDYTTFRDQLDEKQVPLVWSDFGIDIVIGGVADRESNYSDQMFLPSYMMDRLDEATIDGEAFVREKKDLLAFSDAKAERWKIPFVTPFKVCSLILVFFLMSFLINNKWTSAFFKYGSLFWFLVMTIASLIILFLWFFTDHLATKENWNLLWINPFSILAILLWSFIPQRWHMAFLPMMLTSVVIALGYLRTRKHMV